MKSLFQSLLFLSSIVIFLSCSDQYDPLGKWGDNIKLSTKNVEFNSTADSVTITTEGEWWWVNEISVGDTSYHHFEDINLEADNYVIQDTCFVVERRDKTQLFIKVDENPSNVERVIVVGLEAGDYFDRVTVKQKPN